MSTVKEKVDEILSRPMSRQQFLKHVGLLALAVFGITNLLNFFDPKGSSQAAASSQAYGGSVYGGSNKKTV